MTAELAKLSKHSYKVQGTGADDQPNWIDFYYAGEERQEEAKEAVAESTAVELVREDGLVQGDWREAAAAAWAAEAAEDEEAHAVTGWDARQTGGGGAQTVAPTTLQELVGVYSDSE